MNWLRHLFESRYLRLLEEEVDRLRAENRALVNSLLGTAGFPPVNFPEGTAVSRTHAPCIRRRSWQQFQTAQELEAARREKLSF